jgi:hypothetical protein
MRIHELDGYEVLSFDEGNEIPKAVDWVKKGKANGINTNFLRNWPKTLDPLGEASNLRCLIINPGPYPIELDFLRKLQNLEVLSVCTDDRVEIDYSCLPKLQKTALFWRPKAKSLFQATQLKSLFLGKYTGKDLLALEKLVNLEHLRVNTGSVISLKGIKFLRKLQSLHLAQVTKLTQITEITSLPNLKKLIIDNCAKVSDIDMLKKLPSSVELYTLGTTPKPEPS